MYCYGRKFLTGLLIAIGISSLFTNIYYVYKFGPPYQSPSHNLQDVRTFPPIAALRHKNVNNNNVKVRRSLVNVPPEAETEATSIHKITAAAAAAAKIKKSPAKAIIAKVNTTSATITKVKTDAVTTSKPGPSNGQAGDHVHSFLLAASYSDSIGSLPKSLLQLGQFAKDLDISDVVAPWVFGYRVYGLKRLVANTDRGQNSIAVNRLYDMKSVNNLMAQCSHTMLTLFTDFIEKASRNVTVIYFVRNNFVEPSQFHLLKDIDKMLDFGKSQVVDCTSLVKNDSQTTGKDLINALNAELTGNGHKFHISSFICIDNSKVVKMEHINNFLRKRKGNHTVVLLNWKGYAPLINKPYEPSKYWVETTHTFPGDKCHIAFMPLHFELPKVAHQFLTHTGISGTNYISVYVSFEYFARLNNDQYTDCCLKETDRVIRSVMTKRNMNQVLIIGDHSKYSSSTCDSGCVKRSFAMVTTMTKWGLNVTRFDPDVTSAKHHHPAYNLFAEINLLSTSKMLIMVGQNLLYSHIKSNFLQRYPTDGNTKLYAICINSGTYLRDLTSKTIQCKEKLVSL